MTCGRRHALSRVQVFRLFFVFACTTYELCKVEDQASPCVRQTTDNVIIDDVVILVASMLERQEPPKRTDHHLLSVVPVASLVGR